MQNRCIRSETAQKRLFLEDDDLTLENAVKIATSQEAADSSTQLIRHNSSPTAIENQTNKVKSSSSKQPQYASKNNTKIKQWKSCSGCGGKHMKKDCPHKDVVCHRCNKSGHFARRCLSQFKSEGGEGKHKTSQIKNVKQLSHDNPIMINVRLNGVPTDLELDTASGRFKWTGQKLKKQCSEVCRVSNELSLDKLLKEYSDVFDQPIGTIKGFKAKLMLKEDAIPRFFKSRPVPFALQNKVDKGLEKMEKSGVINRIETSEWASPLVVVPKPNGAVRITGDFKRTINGQLHIQQYPLARVEEILEKISGSQTFTKLDGPDAFHQVEVEESCKKYLVINIHRGLYRYNVLPQGISSSPVIFQELMDRMLKGIPMTGSFVDDTISTGKNNEAHLQNLKMILQQGICTDPEKVESIMSMKGPRDVKEAKSFLGLVNFYSKFINNLSHLCEPLNKLTRIGVVWNWNNQCKESFKKIKKSVSSAPVLAHYQQNVPIGIACDASSVGIGVVLFHHHEDGSEQPIYFASKTLSSAERNYLQVEKEALSVIFGVKRFIQYLYGHRFILITDHNPLLAIFSPNRDLPSLAATRLHRWAMYLSSFLYDIEYRNTHHHSNADALSRLPLNINQPVDIIVEEEVKTIVKEHPISSSLIKLKTSRDPTLSSVIRFIRGGWLIKQSQLPDKLKPYFTHRDELIVEQGIVMWGIRVIVPEALRQQVLEQLHETHSGIVRMKSLARSHVWWPGIDKDIESLVKSYACSKWPEIYNLGKDTSSALIIQCIRESIARYGIPDTIVSDNGPQFVSREFEEFCKGNDVRHTKSSAYHPRTHTTTGAAPSELMMRRPLKCRLDLLHPNVDSVVRNKQEKQQQQFGRKFLFVNSILEIKFGFKRLEKMTLNGVWVSL
ncbi:PREDICTED: uncharacterized protein K02A2.6-like [Cyphomyrmex costatus]|uniref:uncharacterized protein K02A2.6-like n=1 Tax=Cyphomyrmex costatus TaxID=456900 RepID=UPI0008524225|nr:PREDICTED: uncharacterized protein K02A2.6-like [Cyphomyrmex costatus]